MSKLYTTVRTDAIKTAHTARGHHWVKATLQSFDGSVQLTLDENGNVEMFAEEGSTAIPSHLVMRATLASLLDRARSHSTGPRMVDAEKGYKMTEDKAYQHKSDACYFAREVEQNLNSCHEQPVEDIIELAKLSAHHARVFLRWRDDRETARIRQAR